MNSKLYAHLVLKKRLVQHEDIKASICVLYNVCLCLMSEKISNDLKILNSYNLSQFQDIWNLNKMNNNCSVFRFVFKNRPCRIAAF